MSGSLSAQFWVFVFSGIVVSWVPLLAGFIIRHRKLIEHIDNLTKDQTGDIEHLTEKQTSKLTGTIATLTDAQTQQITELVAEQVTGHLLAAAGHPPARADGPPEQYHEHDRDSGGGDGVEGQGHGLDVGS